MIVREFTASRHKVVINIPTTIGFRGRVLHIRWPVLIGAPTGGVHIEMICDQMTVAAGAQPTVISDRDCALQLSHKRRGVLTRSQSQCVRPCVRVISVCARTCFDKRRPRTRLFNID